MEVKWLTEAIDLKQHNSLLTRKVVLRKLLVSWRHFRWLHRNPLVVGMFIFIFLPFQHRPLCDKPWACGLMNIPLWWEAKVQSVTAPIMFCLDIRKNAVSLMFSQKDRLWSLTNYNLIFCLFQCSLKLILFQFVTCILGDFFFLHWVYRTKFLVS